MTGATGTRCCGFSNNGCDGSIGLGGRGDGCGRCSNEGGDDNGVLDRCCADIYVGESSGSNWSYGGGSAACSGATWIVVTVPVAVEVAATMST